jgi:branched-chain amino acid transport system permease protein
MTIALQVLLNGITAGSLYALVAVGYNICYRPTNVFNFAQGDFVMLGAMVGATMITVYGQSWIVGVAAAVLLVGLLSGVTERLAVQPIVMRSSSSHAWIISTLAVSLIIANLVGHVWGPDPIRLPPPWPLSMRTFELLGLRISSYQIALILSVLAMVSGIERFYATRQGRAIRAVAEDRGAALLRGIDPARLSFWSFVLAGVFAGLSGVLAAPVLYASLGLAPLVLIKGFEAAAIGGIGDNKGALMAGYLLGVVEALGAVLLSPGYQQATTFFLMLAILLVRPQGLRGKSEARYV